MGQALYSSSDKSAHHKLCEDHEPADSEGPLGEASSSGSLQTEEDQLSPLCQSSRQTLVRLQAHVRGHLLRKQLRTMDGSS